MNNEKKSHEVKALIDVVHKLSTLRDMLTSTSLTLKDYVFDSSSGNTNASIEAINEINKSLEIYKKSISGN